MIGALLVGGPLVAWIVGALEGAVIVGGLSALGAGMYSIGIPKDSIIQYETALKANKFVLIAHGSPDEVSRAQQILEGTNGATTHLHLQEALAGARALNGVVGVGILS